MYLLLLLEKIKFYVETVAMCGKSFGIRLSVGS